MVLHKNIKCIQAVYCSCLIKPKVQNNLNDHQHRLDTYDTSNIKWIRWRRQGKRIKQLWTILQNTLLLKKNRHRRGCWNTIICIPKKDLLNVSMCSLFFAQRITSDMGKIGCLLRESDLGGRVTFYTFCTFEFCSKWIYYLFNKLFLKKAKVYKQ